jgi:CRP-like cAMP-binding protein
MYLPEWLTTQNPALMMSGNMKKKSETTILSRHTWNVRFFALFQHTGILSYWLNKNDFAKGIPARGVVSVDRISKVDLVDPKKRRFNIVMEQGARVYMLQAVTVPEYDLWIKNLQEYEKGRMKLLTPEEKNVRKSPAPIELYNFCRELGYSPLAIRFTPAQMRSFASFFTSHTYAKGESIFKLTATLDVPVLTPTATASRHASHTLGKEDEWKHTVRQTSSSLDRSSHGFTHSVNLPVYYHIVNGEVALSAIDPTQELNKLAVMSYQRLAKECVDAASLQGHLRLVRAVVPHSANSCTTLQISSADLDEFLRGMDSSLVRFVRTVMGYEIATVLTNVALFNGCRPELLQTLGCMFRHVVLEAGDILFREGSTPDRMYIVVEGECKGAVSFPDGSEKVLMKFVAHDSICIGGLVLDMPRTLTVTAVTDVILMELRRGEWTQLWNMLPSWTQKAISTYVKEITVLSFKRYSVPFFVAIPEPKMTVLANLCELSIKEPGYVIAKQGEVGDKFFLLAHGTCTVTKRVDEGDESKEMEVGRLGAGSYFGEIALVRESDRVATVTCVTRCVLLSISQEGFNKFFMEAPEAIADFEVKLARAEVGLRSVLYHPIGLKQLEVFLKEEHSQENLVFWKTCRAYREMKEHRLIAQNIEVVQNRQILLDTVKGIFTQYIDEAAAEQVNLKFDRRNELKKKIEEAEELPSSQFLTEAALDECSDEIQALLKTDAFPRFKKSLAFMSFLEQVQSYEHLDASKLLERKTA